jgi:hypothetical protein
VLDRQIKSFSSIDFREYPRGSTRSTEPITGLDSIGAAKGITAALRTGYVAIASRSRCRRLYQSKAQASWSKPR